MKQVAVVGAGITGLTTAYYLAQAGYRVFVYDQERYPAQRTSYANGCQISVSNSETWNTWANVSRGLKWMLKKDAPLLIRPSFDLDRAIWLLKFLWHTAINDYARNTAETIRMGLESRLLYDQIIEQEKIEFDKLKSGILHIYKDEDYFQSAALLQEMYRGNGCEWELLNSAEVYKKEPALHRTRGIVGGVYTASDWTGDIHKFCSKLAKILEQRYQVEFRYNYTVDLHDLKREFTCVVVCAGVGSQRLSASVGDSLSIYPVKGYSITVNLNDTASQQAAPVRSLLDDKAKIVSARIGDRLRIAGTAEFDGENYDIRRERIQPLLNWVHENFPDVDASDYSSFACLRPMRPNMMPYVGCSRREHRIYYNTGHGHLGWTLAPYTAKQIVKEITNGSSS